MELSRKTFSEIIGVDPDALPVYETKQERRKHARVAFGSRAKIFPLMEASGSDGCPVMMRDVSRSGMGFLYDEPMGTGDEFVIHLPRKEADPIQIHSIVHRCEAGGSGGTQFLIGASFELVLNSAEPLCLPTEEAVQSTEAGAGSSTDPDLLQEEPSSSAAEALFDQCISGEPTPLYVHKTRVRRIMERACAFAPIRIPLGTIATLARDTGGLFGWLISPTTRLCKRLGTALQLTGGSSRIRSRLRPVHSENRTKSKKTREPNTPQSQLQAPLSAVEPTAVRAATVVPATEQPLVVPTTTQCVPANAYSRVSLFAPEPKPSQTPQADTPAEAVTVEAATPATPPTAIPVFSTAAISPPDALQIPLATVPPEIAPIAAPEPAPAPPASTPPEPIVVIAQPSPAGAPPAPAVSVEVHIPPPPAAPAPQVAEQAVSSPLPKPVAAKHVVLSSRIGLHTAYARHPRRRQRT